MKRCTSRWTTAVAAAALLGVPAVGFAQTPQPPSTQAQTTTESQQSSTATTPADHVRQAKQALSDIPQSSIPAKDRTKFSQLKTHLNKLDREVSSSATASKSANAKWGTEVAAIDKILTDLIGPETGTGAEAGATATGTSGTTGVAALDETARTKLQEVRRHITELASSMSGTSGQSPDASSTAAPAATSAGSPDAMSTQPSASSAASETGSTAATPSEPSPSTPPASTTEPGAQSEAQPPTQPQPPAASATEPQNPASTQPSAQVDTGAAKQALSDARDSLAQLTALPAAQKLQGETRDQVSQLIANFNELITTQTNWKASYDKVETSLNTLLSANAAANEPGTAATSGTGTSATAGTTGTGTQTGAATAENTAELDPAVRAKLVEFQGHLHEFAQAAGAGEPAAAGTPSSAMPPAASTGSSMNPSNPESTTNPQSPTTQPTEPAPATSAQSTVGTSGATSATPSATDNPSVDREQVTKELDAIQSILAQATNGSLNQSQVDQLNTHVQQLRQLIGQNK